MERKNLRKRVLQARDLIPEQERNRKSTEITERVLNLKDFQSSRSVFIYVGFRSEVSTTGLIRRAITMGKKVSVPLSVIEGHLLIPYQITDPEKELQPGYCSIPEPDPNSANPIDPAEIDLIVLPGSVFDPRGGRLGYGGGYYDRFISRQASLAVRVGIAFEEQVVTSVPVEKHDQPVDILVTEKRVVVTKLYTTERK